MLTIVFELIVTDVKPEQCQKAPSPMLVTLLGMVIEVREEQPAKALPPMLVTLLGMTAVVTYGLQSITVSFLISNPSISKSTTFAPQ